MSVKSSSSSARKRKHSLEDFNEESPNRPRKKPTACSRCHSRKVRCSGGEPCSNCQQSKCPEECIYPIRDQKITVSSSYIEKLLEENQRLRGQSNGGGVNTVNEASDPPVEEGTPARNPLLDDRSWFLSLSTSQMPVHIGEAADTAFATRFRQVLAEDPSIKHIPREYYVADSRLAALADEDCQWPSLSRARLLIKFAMDTIGSCYHCVRLSEIFSGLQQHYRNLAAPQNPVFPYKLWALFSLGEVYSCRTQSTSDDNFPGLAYFARASRVMRILRERPQIDHIETLLLLSLYSLLMNRRYNAYYLASTAVRLGVIMGLHLEMPENQLPDRAKREHRVRIWWTSYVLDRLWASKMGHPVAIQDDYIAVDLPSDAGLSDSVSSDFLDTEYMNASIRLARISRDIITSIYNRRITNVAFSQRVQKALSDLRGWVSGLPKHLQIETAETGRPLPRNVKWLHLSFNQYVIQATRPILLHVFRAHKQLWFTTKARDLKQDIGETALALAEACIRCARHSHRVLTQSWIDGSFAIFDYTYSQYLFSAATILAISSISIGQRNDNDKDNFESAYQFLDQLRKNGNFAAREFCQHLDAVKAAMNVFSSHTDGGPATVNSGTSLIGFSFPNSTPLHMMPMDPAMTSGNGLQPTMTAEMALAEPSLQDFLSQADLDLNFLDTHMQDSRFQSLYVPPALQDENWMGI